MKINKVKLHNFSSYEGNNEFDFEITDAGKNIVLIGGKNGAGKTSLFTAIKVALYGPLAYGYVGVNSHYISKIKDLINSKAFQQEVVESEVQLTLLYYHLFNDKFHISGFEVASTMRRLGIGTAIIKQFFNEYKVSSNDIFLEPLNKESEKFWKKLGIKCSLY